MTTIAWDGKTLAIDSKMCSADIIESITIQKLYLDIGEYKAVAFCGGYAEALDVIDWLKAGRKDDFPKGDSGCVLCVDGKGSLYSYNFTGKGRRILRKGVYADGSGWLLALGAMDAGATAVEAVKIAGNRDVYTGGRIRSYTHSDKRKVLRPAKVGSISRLQARRAVRAVSDPD